METILYYIEKIDGDYAHLKQVEHPEIESKIVARALLPGEIVEGSRIIYEWLQYRMAWNRGIVHLNHSPSGYFTFLYNGIFLLLDDKSP